MAGQIVGTPGYVAPEQLSGAEDVDERADVYALGAILFEILAGEPLHRGGTVWAILESMVARSGARPKAREPGLVPAPELDELCAVATAFEKAWRRVSARELADAITRAVERNELAPRRSARPNERKPPRPSAHRTRRLGAASS